MKLIRLNGKIPVDKAWCSKGSSDPAEHQAWLAQGFNLGLLTGAGLVVVDLDDKEAARTFYRTHRSILKTVVETRRGAHFYFRSFNCVGNKVKVHLGEFTVDVRGEHGCVVFPPSVVQGFRYRFVGALVPLEELPELPVIRENQITQPVQILHNLDRLSLIARARSYVSKMEPAIAGSAGHNATFRVACKLRDYGLTLEEAWPVLLEYNTRCVPPWNLRDLSHKLRSAMYGKSKTTEDRLRDENRTPPQGRMSVLFHGGAVRGCCVPKWIEGGFLSRMYVEIAGETETEGSC